MSTVDKPLPEPTLIECMACFPTEDEALHYRDRLRRAVSRLDRDFVVWNDPNTHGQKGGSWCVWRTKR